ncbi:ABC transporter permease [Leucobacter sp. wl10]|uniref:ABC transporter permease n=1 Tax=Leucobacter sp. wl10 TaxID=2304677 RepID=UPI000E5BFCE0|nr:ABC transporter permease [Leucobacter sp. wl10]RGE23149.1 ABC transporter permease [Leucobacter sp. wl10]
MSAQGTSAPPTGPFRALARRRDGGGRPRGRGVGWGNWVGFAILAAVSLLAVGAQWIAPYDPAAADPLQKLLPPLTEGHLLGTDELGRDMLSRLIYGGRFALFVAVVPTVLSAVIGGVIGLLSGYIGGWLDALVMRIFDIMFSFPGILLALGIGAALGAGTGSMIVAMVVVTIPETGRVVRGAVLAVREEPYIESAVTLGLGRGSIVLRHIAPNVLNPMIVMASLQTGNNVILAASLSFLGLGAKPPTADWGGMLSGGKAVMVTSPHVATLSGIAIVILAVGFNLAGDALRDKFDPRTRISAVRTLGGLK